MNARRFRLLILSAALTLLALPAVAQPAAPYSIAAAKDFSWQVVIGDTGAGRTFTPMGTPGGGVKVASKVSLPSGQSFYGLWMTPSVTTFATGTTAAIYSMLVDPPAITSTGATITNATNLKIGAAPTAGSTNYSLWVLGASRFDAAQTTTGTYTSSDATTPQFILSAGSTNTGKFVVNGKTSGSTSYTTADATAQAITVTTAAQTAGAATLTIPDQAGVSSNFVFSTLAQNLTNKTLTAPIVATITNTGTLTLPSATGGIGVLLNCGATGTGNQTCSPTAATALTKSYAGSSTLSSNAAIITFPTAFAATTSYQCVANDITTRANPVQMVSTSTTTATITNTTGASDVINWICIGQ